MNLERETGTSSQPESKAQSLLRPKQRLVVPVVLAEELVHAVVFGQERKSSRDPPRSSEHIGILDHRFVFQRPEVRATESLDVVERLCGPVSVDLALLETN